MIPREKFVFHTGSIVKANSSDLLSKIYFIFEIAVLEVEIP